ncbi:hypothetical protein BX600DRAFT_434727 [Xylariales sp. PMI_506]|nr:hypothetical protein BX600DRAFT_434727 [Xylariales sp. PMI_506]
MSDLPPFNRLPLELLAHIFGFLAQPAPSEILLHEEPTGDMLDAKIASTRFVSDDSDNQAASFGTNLKSLSFVSKKWRSAVLPLLFRNVLWKPEISSLSAFNVQPVPLLEFIIKNGLESYVTTFTLLVGYVEQDVDSTRIAEQIRPGHLEWLWDRLFSVVDPLRFTIIAPPTTLAAFLNRMLFLDDAWAFNIPYHILSLARCTRAASKPTDALTDTTSASEGILFPTNAAASYVASPDPLSEASATSPFATPASPSVSQSGGHCSTNATAPPSPLFTVRPWTSLLLNEGSSIRAYQTYEFFLRSPPSMLSALLGFGEYPNNRPLLPPSITDFNYIAVFPLASHMSTMCAHLPRVRRLFVQLAPTPSNQVLQDREAMQRIDMADLWMERNTAYTHMFTELTHPHPLQAPSWRGLRVFESGDPADETNWDITLSTRLWKPAGLGYDDDGASDDLSGFCDGSFPGGPSGGTGSSGSSSGSRGSSSRLTRHPHFPPRRPFGFQSIG